MATNTKVENFPLANPIAVMLGKDPKEFTREDIIKVMLEKNIERLTFHYTGSDGKIKELRIPIANRRQAEVILTEGERVDGSSLFKGMVDAGSSDMYVVPVFKTAFLNPFDPQSLDFVCRFLDKDGNLAAFAPDNILCKAHELLKKNTGLELWALGELEFYLLSDGGDTLFPLPNQKGYHSSAPYVKTTDILNEMLRYITQISGNVKYAHHEVGYLENIESDYPELKGKNAEQVEIEFLPTPIEDTGDIIVLSRWIIRNVAYQYGLSATFTPKLEVGHAGSGMHFHLQLMKDGQNVMTDAKGVLSDYARQLIGGLCKYAPSLTAFGNTVASSYLRLVPHQEAPTLVCWSEMNRSALIRVPLGWSNIENLAGKVNPGTCTALPEKPLRQTAEIRTPDGSANSHMLLAGITLAAEWGLTHGKESLEKAEKCYVKGNIHDSEDELGLEAIAANCVESGEILDKNRDMFVRDGIFTPQVINFVVKSLAAEDDKDLNKRLMALPDADKLKESRRIMHRDLHKN